MDYEIIDKPKNLPRGRKPYWKPIFDELPPNKCLLIRGEKKFLQHRAVTACGVLRRYRCPDYKLCYRIIPDGDEHILYIWKENRDENADKI